MRVPCVARRGEALARASRVQSSSEAVQAAFGNLRCDESVPAFLRTETVLPPRVALVARVDDVP